MLLHEALAHILGIGQAYGQVRVVVRPIVGFEDKILHAERDAKVKIAWVRGGKMFGVVPQVHLRAREQVFEFSQRDVEVGVAQLPSNEGEHVDNKKILNAEAQHSQWDVLQPKADEMFHK